MRKQAPWHLGFAGALGAASILAAAFEPYPPIFLSICLIVAVCFAVKTIRDDEDA